jgi:hypothetical protein
MNLFVKIHERTNPGKPAVMLLFPRDFEKMEYIMGFGIPVLEYLSEKYHPIVITGENSDITHFKKYAEVWGFSANRLGKLKDTAFKRAVEMEGEDDSNWEYNQKIVVEELAKSFGEGYFGNLHEVYIIDPIDFILPQTSYVSKKESELLCERKNEFHDTVNSDESEIEIIKRYNEKTGEKYYSRCSVLAFGSHNKNISMALIEWAVRQNPDFSRVLAFINDPAFYTPVFREKKIPFTALYFANDMRGTRQFHEFPIGQLQHLVWDERKKKKDLLAIPTPIVKDRDFFFAGTIFQEKGGRVELYKRYLQDLNISNSSLFIPQRANGIVYTKNNNDRFVNKLTDKFSELLGDVTAHPMYAGHLIPAEYEEEVKRYRYGLLLRCVSYYDSLNFRPILYARLGILPLIDPGYDPQGLQIPLEIQQHLQVSDAADIEKKVNYFNENPEHREELLKQLEYKFGVKTFDRDWKKILSLYI